jgi:G3E family GTPase
VITNLEGSSQIAGSDIILLNKVDLVNDQQRSDMEAVVRGINPAATIYKTTQANVNLDDILGVGAYGSRSLDPVSSDDTHGHHDHADGEDCTCVTHFQVKGISSLALTCPPLDEERFNHLDEWIRSILWDNKLPGASEDSPLIEVLRCKGLFSVGDTQRVLQGVRNIYDITPAGQGHPSSGKLVFIGRNLDADQVRASLHDVVWK